jgi:protein SMG6
MPRARKVTARSLLHIVPGFTILVVDTNILLCSLNTFATVVESLRWTVVVPLPVIMELDGLSSNTSQLGEAAQAALSFITSHVRSHSTSLKVQTSKGNYLTSLAVRTEQVDFGDAQSREQCMDDLILKAAIWQDEHWIDRSSMLMDESENKKKDIAAGRAVKVVLLSLDRNRRSLFLWNCDFSD